METEYSIEFSYHNKRDSFTSKTYNKDLFKKKDTISKSDALTVLKLIESYMEGSKIKFLPHDIVISDTKEVLFTIDDLKKYL